MNRPDSAADVRSPCVRICELNEALVCVGCGRTLEDIGAWSQANSDERRRILEQAAARLPDREQG